MAERLTALDATFLELEDLDDGALMSIGGVMVFDGLADGGVPSLDEVRASLASRLGRLPRYTCRLSSPHVSRWSWPRWVEDDRFDLTNHVSHASLPAPGDDDQLCDWTAEFFSHPLDRSRPLWEMVLVEGLAGGRWAIGWKTHHCLVDGVGSVGVVDLLLDTDPQTDPVSGPMSQDGTDPEIPGRLHPPDAVAQAAEAGVRAAASGVHAALHPRDALERSTALGGLLVRDELLGAPHTSLNVPIGQTRRYAVVRVPLAELKAMRRVLGGSVNDVVLAACTGGLRALIQSRGEVLPPAGLRAMVPMNLRDAAGELALGNRVTSLFVDLPVWEEDPVRRLHLIAELTGELKRGGAARGPTTLLDLADLAPPVVLHAALARTGFSRRLFNVTITNVPGQQWPLYAFGAQMREVHPFVPLAAEHAVGIAIFSYNGLVIFGVSADCTTVPDLDVLAYGIEEGLEQMRDHVPQLKETPEETRI